MESVQLHKEATFEKKNKQTWQICYNKQLKNKCLTNKWDKTYD